MRIDAHRPRYIDFDKVLVDMRLAQQRMSKKNDHRTVMHRAELALMTLLRERSEHSKPEEATNAPAET